MADKVATQLTGSWQEWAESVSYTHLAGLNPAALILLLALRGGGGVFAYVKLVKNNPKTKGNDSLDDYDYGEEDSCLLYTSRCV